VYVFWKVILNVCENVHGKRTRAAARKEYEEKKKSREECPAASLLRSVASIELMCVRIRRSAGGASGLRAVGAQLHSNTHRCQLEKKKKKNADA
jgi:hypothetical protein